MSPNPAAATAKDQTTSFDDIDLAYARIRHQVLETPLIESKSLGAMNAGRVFLKCENLQHTGSFKFRGASNALLQMTPPERERGVLAYSSGNHAQGVACAAALLGVQATIVMPQDAPQVKIDNTRGHGAQVVLYDRYSASREEIGAGLAERTGAKLVKPYDDLAVIPGQGTAGLECAHQLKARGITPNAMVVCCGGGGLAAGCGLAMTHEFDSIDMHIAEPADFDDFGRSLTSGTWETNDPAARSICDAIITPSPGQLTFPIVQSTYVGGMVADDETVRNAVKLLFNQHRLVVEPGGAIAVASFMAAADQFNGQNVVLMISGGNVDTALLMNILSAPDDKQGN